MNVAKRIIVLTLILFTFRLSAQTTEEEYKYLSKGYQIQLESGLDMKKGYYFKDVGTVFQTSDAGNREVGFLILYREATDAPAGLIMSYKRTDVENAKTTYTGIPMPKSDYSIIAKFQAEITSTVSSYNSLYQARAIAYGLMYLFSYQQFYQDLHERGLSDTIMPDLSIGMTEIEYNYLTKGYKLQLEGGLDDKRGYHFNDLYYTSNAIGSEIREYEFKNLIREDANAICGTLVNYKRTDVPNGVNDFLAIPNFLSPLDIWDKCNENVKSAFQTPTTIRAFIMALFDLNLYELENNYDNNYWSEINKKKGLAGRYEFDNGKFTLTALVFPESNGMYVVKLSTASEICVGEISEAIKMTKTGEGKLGTNDCKISINIKKDNCILIENNYCLDYHGASCGFDGTLVRK
jgi:hypothetical protein